MSVDSADGLRCARSAATMPTYPLATALISHPGVCHQGERTALEDDWGFVRSGVSVYRDWCWCAGTVDIVEDFLTGKSS